MFAATAPRLHYGRGALQLPAEDLPPGGRRTLRRHPEERPVALRGLQSPGRDEIKQRNARKASGGSG